jgi:hypothetical protein
VHHYISIILMFGAAGMLLSDPLRAAASKRRITGAIWAFVLLSALSTEAGQLFGRDGIDWARALGAYLLPSMLLAAVVLREAHGATVNFEQRDRPHTAARVIGDSGR